MFFSSNYLRIITFLLLFQLAADLLFSQSNQSQTVSGFVFDEQTGEAIPEVNVYLSQTTSGAYTKEDGRFEFSTELTGIHNIVFSYVGYNTEVREVNFYEDSAPYFEIGLSPESRELDPLEVTASNNDWKANLEIFKRNFIGATGAALNTEIENPWVISFEKNEDGNLIAQTESPLTIKNYTIGYELYVDLFEFIWPLNGEPGHYLFYAGYREMEPLSKKEQESWERNRRNIYLGSFEHFLKCLHEDTLGQNNFYIVLPNTNNLVTIHEIDSQTAEKLGLPSKIAGSESEEIKAYRIRFPVDVVYGERRWFKPSRARSRIVPLGIGGIFLVTNRARLANPLSFRLDGAWSKDRLANLLPVNYSPEE